MENPTPTIQRRRRSERYQQQDIFSVPQTPAAPIPPAASPNPPPYQRTPRSARAYEAAAPVMPQQPPRPRALQQVAPASAFIRDEAPPVMARPPKPSPAAARRKPAYRMPWWITALIIGLLVLILALTAAQNMMAAYLVQQEQARADAYQTIVDEHPIYYKDLIERYAAEYNLRPAFVCAIVMNESSFRSDAMSSAGARGLMQLMPDTAEWIAGKLDVEGYHFDRMYDPESNIRFGCWYLNYLSKLFRGDPILIACAYHAGQSNVTAWLSNSSYSSDGLTISLDRIPMDDSKTYAGRVTEDYGIYDALYFHAFNQDHEEGGSAASQLSVFADLAAHR